MPPRRRARVAPDRAHASAPAPARPPQANGTANLVQPGFTSAQAVAVEVAITFFVFMLCLSCMDAERHRPARAGGSGAEYAPQIAPLVAGTANVPAAPPPPAAAKAGAVVRLPPTPQPALAYIDMASIEERISRLLSAPLPG